MATFTKAELVETLTLSTDIASQAAAKRILELIISEISTQLSDGNEVAVSGLCNFKLVNQGAKSGVAMGTKYTTPAKRVVKIKPSAVLKRKVLV